ncbi:hypothetical protein EUGRSUZ_I02686 [Eucalyptus grandis]|uniref:Uncharacterized protein n=2 Tax=Eucalyptus grandis TaxID=71139 RepID=A0ACC3JJC4_EUCGR|nr:hypothetical protein EUGRSUZ_I02686 [Eucalyptus grandis]
MTDQGSGMVHPQPQLNSKIIHDRLSHFNPKNVSALTHSLSVSPLPNKGRNPGSPSHANHCHHHSSATKSVRENGSNYYELLSLNPNNTSAGDIKKVYRSLALQNHPDASHDSSMKDESTRMLLKASRALGAAVRRHVAPRMKRRSNNRMAQKNGSWATQKGAQNLRRD